MSVFGIVEGVVIGYVIYPILPIPGVSKSFITWTSGLWLSLGSKLFSTVKTDVESGVATEVKSVVNKEALPNSDPDFTKHQTVSFYSLPDYYPNAVQGSVQSEMPKYKSHKVVWALQIKSVDVPILHFVEEGYGPITLPNETFARYTPFSGDYYVVYRDGYKSFSPRLEFENGYSKEPSK